LRAGAGVTGLALASALWCRYCYGTTESGTITEPNDPNWDRLVLAARAAKDDPLAWLQMEDIYGDVGRSEVFRERFASVLRAIWSQGVETVITNYLKGTL
jgi:mannitol 2-dehydrogenase